MFIFFSSDNIHVHSSRVSFTFSMKTKVEKRPSLAGVLWHIKKKLF